MSSPKKIVTFGFPPNGSFGINMIRYAKLTVSIHFFRFCFILFRLLAHIHANYPIYTKLISINVHDRIFHGLRISNVNAQITIKIVYSCQLQMRKMFSTLNERKNEQKKWIKAEVFIRLRLESLRK